VKRHRSRVYSAAKPSRQEIFLPSSTVRGLYEIGTSTMRWPIWRSLAVSSGSMSKLTQRSRSRRTTSTGKTLYEVSMSVRPEPKRRFVASTSRRFPRRVRRGMFRPPRAKREP